jgi:hypothetical protein
MLECELLRRTPLWRSEDVESSLKSASETFGNGSDSVNMVFPSSIIDKCCRVDNENTPFNRERVCLTARWYHTRGNKTHPLTFKQWTGCDCFSRPELYKETATVHALDDCPPKGTRDTSTPPPSSLLALNKIGLDMESKRSTRNQTAIPKSFRKGHDVRPLMVRHNP